MIVEPRDWVKEPLQVLACGLGTQSCAMMFMVIDGLLPRPDIVLHADTGSELPETVALVEKARKLMAQIGIPFIVVRSDRGALHDDYFSHGAIPIMGIRSCTDNFKIAPQRRFIRTIVGNGGPRGAVLAQTWLGITTDEARRRSKSNVKWNELIYPLLDEHPMSRDECIELNKINGWDVGKSGCFCCPYAGTTAYIELRDSHPDLFQQALDLEANAETRVLERSGKPLRMGLLQGRKLSLLDEIVLPSSSCDSGAGCFI